MAVKKSTKTKATAAKKNAEALKTKKKQLRGVKGATAVATKPGKKATSSVSKSKKKK